MPIESRDPEVLETPLASREPSTPAAPATPPQEPKSEPEYEGGRDISKLVDRAVKGVVDAPAAPAPETPAAKPATDTQKAAARAWKAYRDGVEITDFDPTKMTAADFLALQIGYNANGREQRKAFDEVVRNAQQGHYNADKAVRLEQEREHAIREWHTGAQRVESLEGERKVWTQAITAATRGNFEPLRMIVEEFQKAMDTEPEAPAAIPEGWVSQEDLAIQRAGEQLYAERVWPQAQALSQQFGFPPEQIATAIMKMVDQYPKEFFNEQALEGIMTVELPNLLTQLREQHPVVPTAEAKRIAELEAKVEALTKPRVEADNAAVTAAHARRAAAPPGVPTVASGAGEDGIPDFQTAAEARKWLRELKG